MQLQGFTDLLPGDDHRVVALLNGVQVGAALTWDGLNPAELIADFDQSLLRADGNNSLTLQGNEGGQLLSAFELDYDRLPIVEDDRLWLRDVAGGVQAVTGLTGRKVLVIESPGADSVLRSDIKRYRNGDGWAIAFKARPGRDYLISAADATPTPAIDASVQADLRSAENAADYLIIAPQEFSGTAQALAAYRQAHASSGLVKIVWLADIYKGFAGGREDPTALARFLEHARTHWAVAPSTVMLAGKGSIDFKDAMGFGDNFLPVVMAANPWALAESDARLLGDAGGAGGLSIGRLPIINDAEGIAYVDKLIAHAGQLGDDAAYRAVLAADNPDKAGDFHSGADALAEQLLRAWGPTRHQAVSSRPSGAHKPDRLQHLGDRPGHLQRSRRRHADRQLPRGIPHRRRRRRAEQHPLPGVCRADLRRRLRRPAGHALAGRHAGAQRPGRRDRRAGTERLVAGRPSAYPWRGVRRAALRRRRQRRRRPGRGQARHRRRHRRLHGTHLLGDRRSDDLGAVVRVVPRDNPVGLTSDPRFLAQGPERDQKEEKYDFIAH